MFLIIFYSKKLWRTISPHWEGMVVGYLISILIYVIVTANDWMDIVLIVMWTVIVFAYLVTWWLKVDRVNPLQ